MKALKCPQISRVSAFYDKELAVGPQVDMQAHIAGCEVCLAELESLRGLSGRLAGMRMPAVASDLGERLRRRLEAQEERGLLHVAQAMMGIAAALMIASLVGLRMINSNTVTARVEPNPDWAVAAEHPSGDVAGAGQQTVLAQWIVDDLSAPGMGAEDAR